MIDSKIYSLCRNIEAHIVQKPKDIRAYYDLQQVIVSTDRKCKKELEVQNLRLRSLVETEIKAITEGSYSAQDIDRLYSVARGTYFFAADFNFHSYLYFVEWNREPEKRFYQPRMHYLKPMVSAYQDILDGKLDLLTISQPKRTGKSQTGINFVNMLSGKYPELSTLMEGAGSALVSSFYKGCYEILGDSEKYLHNEVFPEAKIVGGSAELKTINLKNDSRFPTIMCRAIDAIQVGLSEATNLLYLDDLVEGRAQAINRELMDGLWERLSGDVLGRRIEGTPIVAAGTRYSIHDPIGRLQEHAQTVGWRWRKIEIPALDPVTDESNYEHYKNGKKIFTTDYLRNERTLLSAEQFESEFQQQPFEAKGLLFPEDKLNRYFRLPEGKDPDGIVSACDTAERGSDSVGMPIAYIYGNDVFIEDCVFDNSPPEHTKPECASMLFKHHVSKAVFESNASGEYYARDVDKILTNMGGKCSITLKRSISNKQTRIEVSSDNIIKHFYFKDKSLYAPSSQYGMMMKELTTYTRSGKVKHDDAPDCLSILENSIRNSILSEITIMQRPW